LWKLVPFYQILTLKSSLRKCYGRHHDLVNRYGMSVTNDHGYVPLIVSTSRRFPHSLLITWFVTGATRQMSLVEQELLTFPEHPSFSRVCVARSLVFYVVFCRSLFVPLSLLYWSLCWNCCLSFDLRILITSLWYLQTFLGSELSSQKSAKCMGGLKVRFQRKSTIRRAGGRVRTRRPPPPPLKLEKIWSFGVKSWFFTRNTPTIFAPPSAIGKNMIFWRKIVIFHTKYPKNFRASLRSAQFFWSAPPLTWNTASAPVGGL
jgi:hypothetical protein